MNTVKNELIVLRWCFWRYKDNAAYNGICARFTKQPKAFNEIETKILGRKCDTVEAKRQALWNHLNNIYSKPVDIRTLKTKQL